MTTLPKTQRAWRVHGRGHPRDVLSLDEIPVPEPPQEHVLVKVEAAALNPVGYKAMEFFPNWFCPRPRIAEHEFAGVVVNGNGTRFNIGDQIFGILPGFGKDCQGALAEFAFVPSTQLATRPSNLTLEQAAGLALVGETVWECLVDTAKVESGQSVFVNGGSSSLGGIAIQLLKAKGCRVAASCSTKNIDLVKSFGADEVFDYTIKPLHEQLKQNAPSPKYHVIFDAVGSYTLFSHSEAYLSPSGVFVAAGSGFRSLADLPAEIVGIINTFLRPTWLGGTRRTYRLILMKTSQERLEGIATLAQEGKIVPRVDSVFAFGDALKAYDRILTSRATGKVVVTIP